MKASARTAELAVTARSLMRLGYSKRAAIRFVASGEAAKIRKALPQIDRPLPQPDTSKSDARREALAKQQRENTTGTATKTAKPEQKPVQKRSTGKHGKPLSFTRFNIKHKDGSVWSYEVKPSGQLVVRPPSRFDVPTYSEDQWRTMHEGINNHINERSKDNTEKGENKQPAKADDKGDQKAMEKSQAEKFVSRFGRSRGFQDIADDVKNIQLPVNETQPLQKAVPFGKTQLQAAMDSQTYSSLSGKQQAAMKVGLDPYTEGIEEMEFADMQRLAAQQQLDVANEGRARLGLPPLELQPESAGLNASWSQM